VGIATNKFLAKFASDRDKPDGLTVMPAEPDKIAAILGKLAVGELWGVGPKTAQKLQQYGIHKVADIQALDAPALQRYLGNKAGAHIYEIAFGRDDREIVTHRDAKSISSEQTFAKDVVDHAILREQVIASIEEAARELRRLNRYARTVFIKVRYSDFSTFTRQASLTAPSRNDRTLLRTALTLLDNAGVNQPVRLIGAGVAGLTIEVDKVQPELPLFSEAAQKREQAEQNARLDAVVDELRSRYGQKVLRRGVTRKEELRNRKES
jgi:DNA polymerase-4